MHSSMRRTCFSSFFPHTCLYLWLSIRKMNGTVARIERYNQGIRYIGHASHKLAFSSEELVYLFIFEENR